MLGCISDPSQDGVFLVPFDACQTANAASFRHKGQGLDNLALGRATAIEDRPHGFNKGTTAGLALIALSPCLGLAKFDDVMLSLALSLAIVDTDLIWTKIACLSKF